MPVGLIHTLQGWYHGGCPGPENKRRLEHYERIRAMLAALVVPQENR